jgi:hypothetical protein
MDVKELLLRSLEQSQGYLAKALNGLTQEEATWSPSSECNSISFILWHIARVEDFFVNRVIQRGKELYETQKWQDKLGTPAKAYQLTVEELRAWRAPDRSPDSIGATLGHMSTEIALHVGQIAYLRGIQRGLDK